MKHLRVGQTVEIVGRGGIFRAVKADEKQGLADLELMSGTHFIERAIAFSAIKEFKEDENQAAARVIKTVTEK
jgi:hypothetical protein